MKELNMWAAEFKKERRVRKREVRTLKKGSENRR